MDNITVRSDLDGLNMPFSMEAEQAVLGSILMEPACISQAQLIVRPEHFYLPQHQSVYGAMISIESEGGKIDPLLVLDRLKREKVYDEASGKNYLFQLAQAVPSTVNIESYCRIVREKYYMRTLINISRETIDDAVAQTESADVLLDAAEQKIYDIRQGKMTAGPSKLSDIIVNEVYDRLTKLSSPEKEQYLGIPTGFTDLDKALTGLNKSDLILVGARPAMGKTSFALNIARNVAYNTKRKVLLFSLEMSKEQLAQRVLSTEARVPSEKMRSGDLTADEWKQLGLATSALSDCELYFDDSSNITVSEMKARIRRLRNVDVVIIDYLGLIRSGTRTENRVQEVTEITRSLKLMAKDLRIPVMCCAQLSRQSESRGKKDHRPQLSDLRESGSIEQDADIVLMLYRDSYYQNEQDEQGEEDKSRVNEAEVIIAKNRHGPTDTVRLIWDAEHTLFLPMEKIRNDR